MGLAPSCRVGFLRKSDCPFPQDSDPERWAEGAFGVLGHRMSGCNLLEHPIIQRSGFLLANGTEIPTHDPGKVDEFRKMEPCPMGVQLLQIKGMVKNGWNVVDCPLLET